MQTYAAASPSPILLVLSCLNPRSSSLFPYTTLFRSPEIRIHEYGDGPNVHKNVALQFGDVEAAFAASTSPNCRDRKSTRLNSSHITISYAVFCLKKKITTSHDVPICPLDTVL